VTIAEFVYTVLLRPRPLRAAANACIRAVLPRTATWGPVRVVLNPRDPVVAGALAFRVYERNELAFVRRTLLPAMTVLDVGANVGAYTALASHAVGPAGRVLAFEPDPESFRYLRETVRENGATNVELVPMAAARREGVARLFTSSSNRGDNRLFESEQSDGSVEVRTVRLDDFLAAAGIERVDFVKIDVQGFEGEALAGLERTLRRSPGLVMLAEFWPFGLRRAGTEPRALLDLLEGFGLGLHELVRGARTRPIADKDALVDRVRGHQYVNLVATRS
jgi:FkbM family methyltransferase